MSPALALLPIVSKKTDLILTLVMTNSESWIVLLSVVSHTVISTKKTHQNIDVIFGKLCFTLKIGIRKSESKKTQKKKK